MEASIFLSGVAEGIIVSLGSPPVKEIVQLWGVEVEAEKLNDTVSTIKTVLLCVEEQQDGNHEVRVWLEKLKKPMYDADDLLDDVSSEVRPEEKTTADKTNVIFKPFGPPNQVCEKPWNIGDKIKKIRKKLDAIAADRKFHLEGHRVKIGIENKKRGDTFSFVLEEDVIGREEDKKAVIALLLDSNVEENVSILPIVGIGGLGKTALAQLVFNDQKVRQHFELRVWVCVSDIFDVKILVENILKSVTRNKQQDVGMDALTQSLRNVIYKRKYLLVLDDVWNEDREKWSSFKSLLMGGARGSRVLLTTRSEMVAKISKTIESYLLKGLGEDESWSLFKKMTFEEGKEPENTSIVAIGKEIVGKCVGVPLAIKTIGGLLYLKNPETEWLSFMNIELSKISQNENGIIPTLKLSYDKLPSHLKQCFAYCSLFPKDYVFNKSTLILLWMAQGFISVSHRHQELEDIGHDYFMHLLWRSFFQEAKVDEFGDVISCKMHGLMRDLAISVAGSLITTIDSIDEKTRHVSVDSFPVVTASFSTSTKIRTLIFPDEGPGVTESTCDAIFSSFQFLRALDLKDSRLELELSSISKLKHLRYLDLSRNYGLRKLPHSITSLQNLQTLRLSSCKWLKELPRDIKKLVNLRHLEIDQCDELKYMPRGLGELTNLETLSKFEFPSCLVSMDCGDLSELNKLNSLRGKLVISIGRHGNDVALQCKAANLKGKKKLRALYLSWIYEFDGSDSSEDVLFKELEGFEPHQNLKSLYIWDYRGWKFPSWLLSLTNLVRLNLEYCNKLQYLPPLSQVPSLKSVSLVDLPALEYISDSCGSNEFSSSSSSGSAPFFPFLDELTLCYCRNLKGWWRRRESSVQITSDDAASVVMDPQLLLSFPRLSTLSILKCPMLTSMPMFPSVEGKLELRGVSSKPFQQTMMMETASSSTRVASPAPLSKLKTLTLHTIGDLETLPEEWLQNLTSLESLRIIGCNRLNSLSRGMQYLSALQYLHLQDCDALDVCNDGDGMQWQGLKSLLSLEFSNLPKLVNLPRGLRYVTTLQKLSICSCDSFVAIPEWIDNCTSLVELKILVCWNFETLPEGMRGLSLQLLEIICCSSILLKNCEEAGVDWHKISHIPQLKVC